MARVAKGVFKKGKLPKFTFYGHPEHFKTKRDEDAYWDKELTRYINGYDGLSGRHYMYLTIGTLKTVTGASIRPRWRDGDEFVLDEYHESIRLKEDLMVVKRREFGLTSLFGGLEPVYNCLVNAGSTSLITSADLTRVTTLFSEKLMTMYNNIPKSQQPARIHETAKGFLHLGKKNKDGTIEGVDSKVYCIDTASTESAAKAFEAYRAKFIFLDELFLHARPSQVLDSSQATVSQGFSKQGSIVFGGSCGASSEKELEMLKVGAAMGEKLWNDAATKDLRTIFIPATMCIETADDIDADGRKTGKTLNFCVNGHSDHVGAREWILKTRDKLYKAVDKSRYYNFIKSYPLTIEEVFEVNRQGVLNPEIYHAVDRAKRAFYVEGQPEDRYHVYRDSRTKQITAEKNEKGKFVIHKLPENDNEYIAGIDPIPFGNNNLEDGSEWVTTIKNRDEQRYDAYYAERNLDSDTVVANSILLQEMYASSVYPDGAPAMMETNRGEVAERIYKELGKYDLLANRPKHLDINYSDKNVKKGYHSNNKTAPRANHYLVKFLQNYADRIRLLRMIDEVRVFPNGNLDLIDAVKAAEMLDADLTIREKKIVDKPKTVQIRVITRDGSGKSVVKWIDKIVK